MPIVIDSGTVTTALALVVGAAAAWTAAIRPLMRRLDRYKDMGEALTGRPGDPTVGRPDQPGLFVTVAALAEQIAAVAMLTEQVRHEVMTNSGGSLKDDVRALRLDVAALKTAADQRESERALRDGTQSVNS